jgi:hypothetical protein
MFEEGASVGRYTIERLTGVVGPIELYVASIPAGRLRLEVYDVLATHEIETVMTSAQVNVKLPREHVVAALDVGRLDDGRVYIARDLMSGSLLSTLVPCDPQRARVLVRDLAICVQAAHQRGFAVGDLRAERVFVETTPDGDRVRLWDLRFARKTEEFSPEAHADLDRCVAILYQLVTGVQTLANLDPDAAPAFTPLFRRAFEQSPAFAYADELIAALSTDEGTAPAQLPVARLLPKKK